MIWCQYKEILSDLQTNMDIYYYGMDVRTLSLFLRLILTVTSVWSTEVTSDIYHHNMSATYFFAESGRSVLKIYFLSFFYFFPHFYLDTT